MLNLIRDDTIAIIRDEANNILKYVAVFLVLYLGFNNISYSSVSILISYIIITNTFYNSDNRKHKQYKNTIVTKKEDLVYARYVISVLIIIITNITIMLIVGVLSDFISRGIVLNDVLFSVNISLIIMSVVLPMFFKYGYNKMKTLGGILSVSIYCIAGSFINMFNDRIYEVSHLDLYNERIILNDNLGVFSSMINKIVYEVNVRFLNIYTAIIITTVLFVLSMYISTRLIVRK